MSIQVKPFSAMTALLLGATSGVGLETAAQLAEAGVPRIIIAGRDAARGTRAVTLIRRRAPATAVAFVAGDASRQADVDRMVATALTTGGVDILVNAVPGTMAPRPFAQLDPDSITDLIRVHLESVFRGTRAVLPSMIERGGGIIITVASDAAKIPTPGESVHGALMAALAMFSRTLALEEARHGIRVHALTPSLIAGTLSYDRMMAEPFSAKLFTRASERAALGVPHPADVAAAAIFLCSPAAARITGQLLTINGGIAVA